MQSPKLYATFLLWLLSELFEALPEVGDPEKPKLVFFFDEAHLLFDDAPKALFDKIEQVVRLIRSKGVGVYFITQNPIDIPEEVAGQLGNRVQHALRAFTPRDQKAIKAAAETFRINPDLDVETAITELKVGEALVSLNEEMARPSIVQRTLIAPPRSRLGPVTPRNARSSSRSARSTASMTRRSTAKAPRKCSAAKPSAIWTSAIQSATRAAGSSVGRQVANELGRAVFGGGRRSSGGGLVGGLVRGVLGSLFK
jgi:DNA helicase HerA-like ATPase